MATAYRRRKGRKKRALGTRTTPENHQPTPAGPKIKKYRRPKPKRPPKSSGRRRTGRRSAAKQPPKTTPGKPRGGKTPPVSEKYSSVTAIEHSGSGGRGGGGPSNQAIGAAAAAAGAGVGVGVRGGTRGAAQAAGAAAYETVASGGSQASAAAAAAQAEHRAAVRRYKRRSEAIHEARQAATDIADKHERQRAQKDLTEQELQNRKPDKLELPKGQKAVEELATTAKRIVRRNAKALMPDTPQERKAMKHAVMQDKLAHMIERRTGHTVPGHGLPLAKTLAAIKRAEARRKATYGAKAHIGAKTRSKRQTASLVASRQFRRGKRHTEQAAFSIAKQRGRRTLKHVVVPQYVKEVRADAMKASLDAAYYRAGTHDLSKTQLRQVDKQVEDYVAPIAKRARRFTREYGAIPEEGRTFWQTVQAAGTAADTHEERVRARRLFHRRETVKARMTGSVRFRFKRDPETGEVSPRKGETIEYRSPGAQSAVDAERKREKDRRRVLAYEREHPEFGSKDWFKSFGEDAVEAAKHAPKSVLELGQAAFQAAKETPRAGLNLLEELYQKAGWVDEDQDLIDEANLDRTKALLDEFDESDPIWNVFKTLVETGDLEAAGDAGRELIESNPLGFAGDLLVVGGAAGKALSAAKAGSYAAARARRVSRPAARDVKSAPAAERFSQKSWKQRRAHQKRARETAFRDTRKRRAGKPVAQTYENAQPRVYSAARPIRIAQKARESIQVARGVEPNIMLGRRGARRYSRATAKAARRGQASGSQAAVTAFSGGRKVARYTKGTTRRAAYELARMGAVRAGDADAQLADLAKVEKVVTGPDIDPAVALRNQKTIDSLRANLERHGHMAGAGLDQAKHERALAKATETEAPIEAKLRTAGYADKLQMLHRAAVQGPLLRREVAFVKAKQKLTRGGGSGEKAAKAKAKRAKLEKRRSKLEAEKAGAEAVVAKGKRETGPVRQATDMLAEAKGHAKRQGDEQAAKNLGAVMEQVEGATDAAHAGRIVDRALKHLRERQAKRRGRPLRKVTGAKYRGKRDRGIAKAGIDVRSGRVVPSNRANEKFRPDSLKRNAETEYRTEEGIVDKTAGRKAYEDAVARRDRQKLSLRNYEEAHPALKDVREDGLEMSPDAMLLDDKLIKGYLKLKKDLVKSEELVEANKVFAEAPPAPKPSAGYSRPSALRSIDRQIDELESVRRRLVHPKKKETGPERRSVQAAAEKKLVETRTQLSQLDKDLGELGSEDFVTAERDGYVWITDDDKFGTYFTAPDQLPEGVGYLAPNPEKGQLGDLRPVEAESSAGLEDLINRELGTHDPALHMNARARLMSYVRTVNNLINVSPVKKALPATEAIATAKRLSEDGDIEFVVIKAPKAGGKKVADVTDEGFVKAFTGKPKKGDMAYVVPKAVADMWDKAVTKRGAILGTGQWVTQRYVIATLPLSVLWHAGNVVDLSTRLLMSGANPFTDPHLFRQLEAQAGHLDWWPEFVDHLQGHLGSQQQALRGTDFRHAWSGSHVKALRTAGEALGRVGDSHVGRALKFPMQIPQLGFRAANVLERPLVNLAKGKALRLMMHDYGISLKDEARATQQLVDMIGTDGKGMPVNPDLVSEFGERVLRIVGDYSRGYGLPSDLLSTVDPFWTWTRESLRFVLWHLPAYHPIATAVLINAMALQEDAAKELGLEDSSGLTDFLRGALPADQLGIMPQQPAWWISTQPFTSFGETQKLLADPLEYLANKPFAYAQKITGAAAGQPWYDMPLESIVRGDELFVAMPKGHDRAEWVLNQALEAFVPGYRQAEQAAGQSGFRRKFSTLWDAKSQPGTAAKPWWLNPAINPLVVSRDLDALGDLEGHGRHAHPDPYEQGAQTRAENAAALESVKPSIREARHALTSVLRTAGQGKGAAKALAKPLPGGDGKTYTNGQRRSVAERLKREVRDSVQIEAPLSDDQKAFARSFAESSGLSYRVAAAAVLREGGNLTPGDHNWLNIGWTDSGQAGITSAPEFRNPVTAGKATGQWINGQWGQDYDYVAAPTIQTITQAEGDAAQMAAWASSGWASSGASPADTYDQIAVTTAPISKGLKRKAEAMLGSKRVHAIVTGAGGTAEHSVSTRDVKGPLPGPYEGSRTMIRQLVGSKVHGDKEEGHAAGGDHDPSVPNAYAQDINVVGGNPAEGEPSFDHETLEQIVANARELGFDVPDMGIGSLGEAGADAYTGTAAGYQLQIFTNEGSGPHIHVGVHYVGGDSMALSGSVAPSTPAAVASGSVAAPAVGTAPAPATAATAAPSSGRRYRRKRRKRRIEPDIQVGLAMQLLNGDIDVVDYVTALSYGS